ncbi:MAG: laccase domain-containing protein [Rhodobacter sp.]|nr:laccase domain-containing protein [Rhodobacter sp.]
MGNKAARPLAAPVLPDRTKKLHSPLTRRSGALGRSNIECMSGLPGRHGLHQRCHRQDSALCQPVLFCDPKAGVIGAAHAGWRGSRDGVLEATLDVMEALGANRAAITAVIGPTISQAAYEVGPEFLEGFLQDDPASQRFFANGTGDRMLFDLPGYSLQRLRQAGVGHAEWTHHCTYRDPERFFSFRRTTHAGEADYGRLISVIRL